MQRVAVVQLVLIVGATFLAAIAIIRIVGQVTPINARQIVNAANI